MPGWALLLLGVAAVVAVCLDVIHTTILVSRGSGPLTNLVTRLCSAAGAVLRRVAPRLLGWLGPASVCAILASWGALLCAGWLLVFAALDPAFLRASDGVPASLMDRLYHVLVVVWGRGSGPAEPAGVWFLGEQLAGLTGLVIVSLSISYLIPIVGAVAHMRSVASSIHALGRSPFQVLTRAWRPDAEDFGTLELYLVQLGSPLGLAAQRHLAYPPLQFFYSSSADEAASVQAAKLQVTLDLLEHASLAGFDRCALEATRDSLGDFLEQLGRGSSGGAVAPEDRFWLPDLAPLRAAGIPLRPRGEVEARLRQQREVYQELSRRLAEAGFAWSDVLGSGRGASAGAADGPVAQLALRPR